jgi:Zn-dependent protease with chaperone function
MRNTFRTLSLAMLAVAIGIGTAAAKKPTAAPQPAAQPAPAAAPSGNTQATVYKDNVAVHQAASATAPTLASLSKGSSVDVQKQEGLWFNVKAQPSTIGYVKINEIRLAKAAGGSNDGYSMFGGHPKPSETAGVRGFSDTDLRGATMNEQGLAQMQTFRVDAPAASAYANRMHLQHTDVAYKDEPGIGKGHMASSGASADQVQAQQQQSHAAKAGILGMVGGHFGFGASASAAADALPESEQEKTDEELVMGPQIAGRVLSVMPLLNDPQAQRRVNIIGRWVAAQTPRDDLPWTFAVVDSPEMNAFATPGGYILVTRGLYEVLQSDDEVAAVLGHEISHVVARDHYNVIRKQAMSSALMSAGTTLAVNKIGSSGGGPFAQHLAGYLAKEGAMAVLTHFDKDVEYRSDGAALIYTARAGYNPLAMYAVLQKLSAVSDGNRTSNLYKTHPSATSRLDKLDQKGLANVVQYTDRPYVLGMR